MAINLLPFPKIDHNEVKRKQGAALNRIVELRSWLNTNSFCHVSLLAVYNELETSEKALKETLKWDVSTSYFV